MKLHWRAWQAAANSESVRRMPEQPQPTGRDRKAWAQTPSKRKDTPYSKN